MSAIPPSVLIVHNRYRTQGGEENVVEQQAHQLIAQGHIVDAYYADSAEFGGRSMAGKAFSAMQMPFSVSHYLRLRARIRRMRPSIIHVHNVFPLLTPSVYYAAKAENVPVVQSVHNYRFMCSNGLFLLPNGDRCERCAKGSHFNAVRFGCYSGSRLRSAGMALSLSVHRALSTFQKKIDAFIAPSNFLRDKLIQSGFPAEKIFKIAPGLAASAPRTIEQSESTLLFVGRLSREKGLLTLLKAAKSVPDWNFQLAGDGPLKNELESTVKKENLRNVRLLGRLSSVEVQAHMQKATALVLPSECYENLPTVILEAWSYGLPVIASRLGGMAELIEEGKTGCLFNAGDVQDLVLKLRNFNLEKSRAMHGIIEQHYQKNYSEEAAYQALMGVYRKVL